MTWRKGLIEATKLRNPLPRTRNMTPTNKGWKKQANRYRLTISLSEDVADKVDQEAQRLGLAPSILIATILGQHFADPPKTLK